MACLSRRLGRRAGRTGWEVLVWHGHGRWNGHGHGGCEARCGLRARGRWQGPGSNRRGRVMGGNRPGQGNGGYDWRGTTSRVDEDCVSDT